MIYRWTYDTDILASLDDLKRTFADDSPHGRAIERFELQFSPAFGDWLAEHPTWRRLVEDKPAPAQRPRGGWMLCDSVHLVPSTVCQGLARFVGIIDGGRTIRYATIVGGSV